MASATIPTPIEQLLQMTVNRHRIGIGLPKPSTDHDRRFPLTPEAAGMLVERGFSVKMQRGAAESIHYDDYRYQRYGVEIVDRATALRCDIVLSMSQLSSLDARMIKKGAMLLGLYQSVAHDTDVLRILLANHVVTIALDLVQDDDGHHPFADILSEISGRSSIAIASSLLVDSVHGKGILLGGVVGIVPCEVCILGSGIDARAAACSAIGLGAIVRMFDNDVYRLRRALREIGPGASGSALHPRVLVNALKTSDVVIATEINPPHVITDDVVSEMKQGVITMDLNPKHQTFPSMPQVDLGDTATIVGSHDVRVCFVNPGNAVPRTAAMALGTTFISMINDISTCEGTTNALMLNHGLQVAVLTFMGKPVNRDVARMLGMRHVDLKLILQFS